MNQLPHEPPAETAAEAEEEIVIRGGRIVSFTKRTVQAAAPA